MACRVKGCDALVDSAQQFYDEDGEVVSAIYWCEPHGRDHELRRLAAKWERR